MLRYITALLFLSTAVVAQRRVPDVFIEDSQRQTVSATQVLNADGPTIISFWATWCKPCLRELQAINANLATWEAQTNVKIVTISVDDARTKNRVAAVIKTKKWDFENYMDPNGDLQRSMNILNVPFTVILNKNGDIIYQHNAYAPGDEAKYFDILKGL